MGFHLRRMVWVSTFLLGLSSFGLASSDLKLSLEPVFEGNLAPQGIYPVVADIQNVGPDAQGVLAVVADTERLEYPVELPRGSHKLVFTYPKSHYGEIRFSLTTDHGKVDLSYAPRSPRVDGIPVLLISDRPGELAFIVGTAGSIRSGSSDQALSLVDSYVKPGLAPARSMGYSGTTKIILGSGSERLSDEQVAAIKLWVVTGGSLTFVGGVSSPVLSDRRWADLLPATNFHVTDPFVSVTLKAMGAESDGAATEDVPATSMLTGTPAKDASATTDGSILIWAEKPYGLGKALYMAFNPFESPLNKWDGRRSAVSKILRRDSSPIVASYLQQYAASQSGRQAFASPPYPGTAPMVSVAAEAKPEAPIRDDPFSMKLPSTEQILAVLAAYFFVVVPINFLILKKLKRGELAWVTAPIISLAFAGLLFTSAASLYKSKMSTVTNGVVLAQEGEPEGMFIGNTQMFVPHAGSYDLKLKNVDSIGELSTDSSQEYFGGQPIESDFEPIDVGEIEVPGMSANNLTFRKLSYRQRVPISSWFHVQLESMGAHTARCDITNSSPFTLHNAQIAVGAQLQNIADLGPGQHASASVSLERETAPGTYSTTDVRMFTLNKPRVALVGKLMGFRPGPQIGEDIPGRTEIDFAMFSDWQGAGR